MNRVVSQIVCIFERNSWIYSVVTDLMILKSGYLFSEVDKSKVAGYASVDRDTRSLSYLQHPEPSGSFSQDFNRPIQAMMNPVVF